MEEREARVYDLREHPGYREASRTKHLLDDLREVRERMERLTGGTRPQEMYAGREKD